MPADVKKTHFNIVVGHPGDATHEAQAVKDSINEWFGPPRADYFEVEIKIWSDPDWVEANSHAETQQQAILDYCRKADLVIGVFHRKVGTPTDGYESGTVAEVEVGDPSRVLVTAENYRAEDDRADDAVPIPDEPAIDGWFQGPPGRERGLQRVLTRWRSNRREGHGDEDDARSVQEFSSLANLRIMVFNILKTELQDRVEGLPDPAQFERTCRAVSRQVSNEIGKYSSDLFVARTAVARELSAFASSPSAIAALTGDAGMGKSNQMCHMALTTQDLVSLLLQAKSIANGGTEEDFWMTVRSRLVDGGLQGDGLQAASRARLEQCAPHEIRPLLDKWLTVLDRRLTIFVDGVNEHHARLDSGDNRDSELPRTLGHLAVGVAGSPIKVVISCRAVDWWKFECEADLAARLYDPQGTGQASDKRIIIGRFSDTEFEKAEQAYRKVYCYRGRPTGVLGQLCRDPLLLRFTAEAFRDAQLPPGANRRGVFHAYTNEKLPQQPRGQLRGRLLMLAHVTYENAVTKGADEVALDDAIAILGSGSMTGQDAIKTLQGLDVVVDVSDDPTTQGLTQRVRFKHDAFFEYVAAEAIIERTLRHLESKDELVAAVRSFVDAAGSVRFLEGILTHLLLHLATERNTETNGPLEAAFTLLEETAQGRRPGSSRDIDAEGERGSTSERWKRFVCNFVLADPRSGHDLIDSIKALAVDGDASVRYFAGLALGTIDVTVMRDPARTGLDVAPAHTEWLCGHPEWRARKTAGSALAQLYEHEAHVERLLAGLAEDLNWRVRRQAGNTLGDLFTTNPTLAQRLTSEWRSSDRWRLRRAVVQGRRGLLTDPQHAFETVRRIAEDEILDVRWRAVSVAAHLGGVDRSLIPCCLDLLKQLVKDEDVWVRRQVAFFLPDIQRLASEVGPECVAVSESIIEACVQDEHPHVRWEAARSLGAFRPADQEIARRHLSAAWEHVRAMAKLEDLDSVEFAARYSMAVLEPPKAAPSLGRRAIATTTSAGDALSALRSDKRTRVEEVARSLRAPADPKFMNSELMKNDRYTNIFRVLEEERSTGDLATFDLIRADEDEGLRWASASQIAYLGLGGDAVLGIVRDYMKDYQYWVRRECITAVAKELARPDGAAEWRTAEIVEIILTAAHDAEPEVRFAAMECLGSLVSDEGASESVRQALRALVNDPEPQIASRARDLCAGVPA